MKNRIIKFLLVMSSLAICYIVIDFSISILGSGSLLYPISIDFLVLIYILIIIFVLLNKVGLLKLNNQIFVKILFLSLIAFFILNSEIPFRVIEMNDDKYMVIKTLQWSFLLVILIWGYQEANSNKNLPNRGYLLVFFIVAALSILFYLVTSLLFRYLIVIENHLAGYIWSSFSTLLTLLCVTYGIWIIPKKYLKNKP